MPGQNPLLRTQLPLRSPSELVLSVDDAQPTLRMRHAVAGCDQPRDVARQILAVLTGLLPGSSGVLVVQDDGPRSPLAVNGLDDQLARTLAAASAPPSATIAIAVAEATFGPTLKNQLAAADRHGLLSLPLPFVDQRHAFAVLLLPAACGLPQQVSDALDAAAAVAALALEHALDARLAKLAAELETAREQLAAEARARRQAEAHSRAARIRTEQRSDADALTGLTSGRHFHALLEIEVERSRRYGDELGLLLIDIDDFKRFNEAHGQAEGDRVLVRLGEILRQELRKMDSAFRYGGEEFTAVLPRCGQEPLLNLAERLRERFAAETFGGTRLSVSIGAAIYQRGSPVETFIRKVDDALYRAKTGGRNRVVLAAS